mmetsp:Transcript_1987/g.3500  ORF Transcript_1987/g.3500 Transcript_1987/m.3500 type:complete len:90 (-) Transcript_1987:1276-1545(-)
MALTAAHPKYLKRLLNLEGGEEQPDSEAQRKQLVKYFYKVWSGVTKFIAAQLALPSVMVEFPLVGRFFRLEEREQGPAFAFVPSIEFVT